MDSSKEYILMASKAEEIQQDFVVKRNDGSTFVWLPRQDQLRILSKMPWQMFDRKCSQFIEPTKEQAGIKVVMQQQFNKEWKDNKWLRIKDV